ncbi:MAG TPA: ABC transporter permease [Gemmatimonadaceae bacterium]|jgi:predicted permease
MSSAPSKSRRSFSELGHSLQRDLVVAVRSLRRSPTFTIATIVILALGIGMSATMFTVYKGLLIDRLPIADQDHVVIMHPLDRSGTHLDAPYSYLPEIRRDSAVFKSVAGVYHRSADPGPFIVDGRPIKLAASTVSANYFSTLGTRAVAGRLIREEDGEPGATPTIVLSYQVWQRRFGSSSAIVGQTIVEPYTGDNIRIVGIAPPGFTYPAGTEAWLVWKADTALAPLQVDIIARIANDATPQTARAALNALIQRVNPFAAIAHIGAPVIPIADVEVRMFSETVLGSSRATVVGVTLAVALLLVIACTNVGGLVLVRLAARQREVAVRRAIGAGFGDIVHLFVIENLLLGLAGGFAGLLFAAVSLRALAVFAPLSSTRLDLLQNVGAPVAVTAGVALLAMLLFGIAPSLAAARVDSYAALRSDARTGSDGKARRRTRRILVAAQLALAVVLIAGAALLVRSVERLQSMDLGYNPGHLSLLSFIGPKSVFSTNKRMGEIAKDLLTRIETVPGVIAATPVESEPFKGTSLFIMKVMPAEESAANGQTRPYIPWEFVGPNYFQTFQIPILRGRGFRATDQRGSAPVTILNEALAKQLWPNEDALGRQLRVVGDTSAPATVVGIAQNTHFRDLRDVSPVIYFDWEQVSPFWNGYIAIRSTQPLGAMLPALRRATTEYNPSISVWDSKTMDSLLDQPLSQPRLSALLLTAFSFVALLVSAIGLYGLMATAVRQQTRDIGVRVALGATSRDVRRLVLGEAMRVVAIGAGAGIVIAALSTRLLASQLFGVSPSDPRSLLGACVLLIVTGIAAAYFPARRAARIDPMVALRTE